MKNYDPTAERTNGRSPPQQKVHPKNARGNNRARLTDRTSGGAKSDPSAESENWNPTTSYLE